MQLRIIFTVTCFDAGIENSRFPALYISDMKINVNGKPVETNACNIKELHTELKLPPMVAIALENKVIPRSDWASHALVENCSLVIIKVACGG